MYMTHMLAIEAGHSNQYNIDSAFQLMVKLGICSPSVVFQVQCVLQSMSLRFAGAEWLTIMQQSVTQRSLFVCVAQYS